MTEQVEGITKPKWVLKTIFCIHCGKNLGIQMTTSNLQEYFYCSKCHREHLDTNYDLEKSFNELGIESHE